MGRKWERFADVIGIAPRNLVVFLLFVVSALALLMAVLVLVAYASVRVGFLSGLWTPWPPDGAKVLLGILPMIFFFWLRILRRPKRSEREEADAEREEGDSELVAPEL